MNIISWPHIGKSSEKYDSIYDFLSWKNLQFSISDWSFLNQSLV